MKKAVAALALLIPLAACGSATSGDADHGAIAPVCRVNVVYPGGSWAQVTVNTADCSDTLAAAISSDLTTDAASGPGPSTVYVTVTKSPGAMECGGVMPDGSTATVFNPGSDAVSAAEDVCGNLFSQASDFDFRSKDRAAAPAI